MAMILHRTITTAALAAALALGGLTAASAHHGNATEHSTTKGKNLSKIERMERQITAELNRKQLMQGTQVAMVTPVPMADEMPAAMANDEEASLSGEFPELAAVEDEGAAN